ncbi:hypothetical protein LINGRAPRIM_LOCUS1732 [Linum grandiflorum]
MTEVQISWKPTFLEWVSLNSDGFVNPETGQTTGGGFTCDSTSHCLLTYIVSLVRLFDHPRRVNDCYD